MFESIAYAADAAPATQGPSMSAVLPMYLMLFAIIYFFMIRPQQKKAKELQTLVGGLKKGDKVVTTGGILGVVSSIQDDYVVITVGGSDTKIEILKSAIAGLRQ